VPGGFVNRLPLPVRRQIRQERAFRPEDTEPLPGNPGVPDPGLHLPGQGTPRLPLPEKDAPIRAVVLRRGVSRCD
jgi:hypothetical protein